MVFHPARFHQKIDVVCRLLLHSSFVLYLAYNCDFDGELLTEWLKSLWVLKLKSVENSGARTECLRKSKCDEQHDCFLRWYLQLIVRKFSWLFDILMVNQSCRPANLSVVRDSENSLDPLTLSRSDWYLCFSFTLLFGFFHALNFASPDLLLLFKLQLFSFVLRGVKNTIP